MSSQRSRPRGQNRNSEASAHGEELQLWDEAHSKIKGALDAFNASSQHSREHEELEKQLKEKEKNGTLKHEDYAKLDASVRKGVKLNEISTPLMQALVEQLKVVRAVSVAKEQEREQPSSRSGSQRGKDAPSSSVYEFDGAGESVSSPNPAGPRRKGAASSNPDRDSVPPGRADRSTPTAKAGSVEPQSGPLAHAARSKVTFAKDDEVAFKPKPVNNEQTDWILGIVQEVRGEGKARRYKVLDADVDESGNQKDFRTSASSMIPIPKEGTSLPPLDNGKVVLALYPNTTTFYKAEVMGMDADGKVNLKFEGEESSNTMQAVTRRHVVDYRG